MVILAGLTSYATSEASSVLEFSFFYATDVLNSEMFSKST